MTFKKVEQKVNFPKQEEEMLSFWEKEKIFEQSLALRKDAKRYIFFEGPPTANGLPGIHHALARYFKDVFPRYKTMQGMLVERKAGWDTHGLPVEIGVEKELGITSKPEIEKYGVAKFNAKAKESVWQYKELWEKFTKRSGFWLDLEHPYVTYDPKYIESVWAILKTAWDRELIYQGYRVVPRCTRCGTALSSHEVAQGYQEVEENSVFIKFKVKDRADTYILSWTTTSWTLPGNVALAVGEKVKYVVAEQAGSKYVVAADLVEKVLGEGAKVVEKLSGKDLIGWEYEPLFPGAVASDTQNYANAFKVYPADFVTTEDGTGVVHTAVMYGEDDYQLGEKVGLPKFHTVGEDGTFGPTVKQWAGKYVKDKTVEKEIITDLDKRGLLLKEMPYKHDYPFCWRCGTPLLYYAANSWFIGMSKLKDELIKSNQTVNWVPEYFKEGRFGEWLREIKDWGISRERYWGTPLPFWVYAQGEKLCIGSFAELKKLAKEPEKIGDEFDPHKPFVDEIVLVKDGQEYTRVPEVLDVWFDSGAMPFAQWHYPMENPERIDKGFSYPADFISEAVDQTRGWFYTLLAIATLMGKEAPYKNVICLGHILDKNGKKMSKSKGNVVDPWKIFDEYGSDALRWYLYTINQPGLPKNFDEEGVKAVVRRFMLMLWNTYSFFVTYANIDGFDAKAEMKVAPKNMLDQWIWARRNQLVETVSRELDDYDPMQACLALEGFMDDLSNWYVRRSRRRFWKGEYDADKAQAYTVLYSVLKDMTKLLAPFMPFLSEAIYANLKTDNEPASVHLTDWPKAEKIDTKILEQMKKVRELIEIGLHQREQAGIKVRQPLEKISLPKEMFGVAAEMTQDVPAAKAIRSKIQGRPGYENIPIEVVTSHTTDVYKELLDILKDEINVKHVVEGDTVLVDTTVTPSLALEGHAREIVRAVQVLRKSGGLEITDRIKLVWKSDAKEIKETFSKFGEYIKAEVLADELAEGEGEDHKINGFVVKLKVEKAA